MTPAKPKEIRAAFEHAQTHKLHTAECKAQKTMDTMKAAPNVRVRLECTCGAIERAIAELRRKKPPAEQVGSRAAMRRKLRDIADTARFVPNSDEAALKRAEGVLGELAANHAADTRDYLRMSWHMLMRRHGVRPAQRVAMEAHVAELAARPEQVTPCVQPEPTEPTCSRAHSGSPQD